VEWLGGSVSNVVRQSFEHPYSKKRIAH